MSMSQSSHMLPSNERVSKPLHENSEGGRHTPQNAPILHDVECDEFALPVDGNIFDSHADEFERIHDDEIMFAQSSQLSSQLEEPSHSNSQRNDQHEDNNAVSARSRENECHAEGSCDGDGDDDEHEVDGTADDDNDLFVVVAFEDPDQKVPKQWKFTTTRQGGFYVDVYKIDEDVRLGYTAQHNREDPVVFRYNEIPFVCDARIVKSWLSTMSTLFMHKESEEVQIAGTCPHCSLSFAAINEFGWHSLIPTTMFLGGVEKCVKLPIQSRHSGNMPWFYVLSSDDLIGF